MKTKEPGIEKIDLLCPSLPDFSLSITWVNRHIYRRMDRQIPTILEDSKVVRLQTAHGIAHPTIKIFIIAVIVFTTRLKSKDYRRQF